MEMIEEIEMAMETRETRDTLMKDLVENMKIRGLEEMTIRWREADRSLGRNLNLHVKQLTERKRILLW